MKESSPIESVKKWKKLSMNYNITCEDLIRVAKRENNKKRSYLYVNPLQGKHIPVSPSKSLELFALLAEKTERSYPEEKLLVIGFAETATAIGFALAAHAGNVSFVMSTTREEIAGGEYLFFTESHSHATEQRLLLNDLEGYLPQIDRIVFAEDEVTTGNTIQKLICALREAFPEEKLSFGIASLVNSMPEERIHELEAEGVHCDYLLRIPAAYRSEEILKYRYHTTAGQPKLPVYGLKEKKTETFLCENLRRIHTKEQMTEFCMRFAASEVEKMEEPEPGEHILILGSEEFMYPGMLLGRYLEERRPDLSVVFHALTRSPIEVSGDPEYPLHSRCQLNSLYEKGRVNYLYNLKAYARVFVVTDADPVCPEGWESLLGALSAYGNQNITGIFWRNRS